KENQTGRETQAKWKWFERIDTLFGTRENHNPSFLLDGFSNDIDLFNKFEEEKEVKEIIEIKEESLMKGNQSAKKRKLHPQDPLVDAMISMSNMKQTVLEKRLAFENEQFEKKVKIEKEIRETEMVFKKEELAIERLKADTLQKKMEFDIEQSRMEFQLRMKELDIKMLQLKPSSE
ncbi:3884_t:CDS:1, partial [Funneliformis geosporum]